MTATYGTPARRRWRLTLGWRDRLNAAPAAATVTGSVTDKDLLPGETTTKLTPAGADMGAHHRIHVSEAFVPEPGETTTAIGVADTGTRLRLDDPGALQVIRVPVTDRSLDQQTQAIPRPAPAADVINAYRGELLFAGQDPPLYLEVAAAFAAAAGPDDQPADTEDDRSGDVIAWVPTGQPEQEGEINA